MDWNLVKDVAIVFGVPVVRSTAGWAVNALQDNKITRFELRKLASTVISVSFISGVAYFGLNALGMDVGALGASCGAVLFDMVIRTLKKAE